MPNRTYALEWINLAYKNLETARLLLQENHFTDSIAVEIQQTIEKSLKCIYAFEGSKIPRTHNLILLFKGVGRHLTFHDVNMDDLIIISDYYENDRYPGPRYEEPSRDEVENYFELSERIYQSIREYITTEEI